jgi:indolepyruvate ferredoxin oxidoreductase
MCRQHQASSAGASILCLLHGHDYEALIDEVLNALGSDKHALAVAIARVPETIRGYGHVKLANVASAQARWRELLDRWHGREAAAAKAIPIVAAPPRLPA